MFDIEFFNFLSNISIFICGDKFFFCDSSFCLAVSGNFTPWPEGLSFSFELSCPRSVLLRPVPLGQLIRVETKSSLALRTGVPNPSRGSFLGDAGVGDIGSE